MPDRISAASNHDLINDPESDQPWLDTIFGHSWSWTPKAGAAIYGRTDFLPNGPLDDLAKGKFLRVPFRRIPIIDVHSISEIRHIVQAVLSFDTSIQSVWRGQSNQYYISRDDESKLKLYGEITAKEPSLLPSASRSDIYFPDSLEAWSGLLDLYTEQKLLSLVQGQNRQAGDIRRELDNFRTGYLYRLWGLATAQHYGLPSVGLDLTTDIDVALFFALHQIQVDQSTGKMIIQRASESADPIIYGLGVFENDLLNDESLSPNWLQCARPKAQKAMFFSTAWGCSGNKAAERIFIALKLVNHASWHSPLNAEYLFPKNLHDSFAEFLLSLRGKVVDPQIENILSRIYFAP